MSRKLYDKTYDMTLTKEGKVIYKKWIYDEEAGVGAYHDIDKTDSILHVLNKTVEIEPGFTVKHLFDIVAKANENNDLTYVFENCFIDEFVSYYKSIIADYVAPEHKYDPSDIEYIHLYWHGELDACTQGSYLCGVNRPDCGGTGWVLEEDSEDGFYKKGTRISWAIDFSSVESLLHLPIVADEELVVVNDMMDWQKEGRQEVLKCRKEYTLRDVIEGFFWEISFHGAPESVAEKKAELMSRMDEIENGTAKLIPFEDVLNNLSDEQRQLIEDVKNEIRD